MEEEVCATSSSQYYSDAVVMTAPTAAKHRIRVRCAQVICLASERQLPRRTRAVKIQSTFKFAPSLSSMPFILEHHFPHNMNYIQQML